MRNIVVFFSHLESDIKQERVLACVVSRQRSVALRFEPSTLGWARVVSPCVGRGVRQPDPQKQKQKQGP